MLIGFALSPAILVPVASASSAQAAIGPTQLIPIADSLTDQMLEFIRRFYIFIGGDPKDLDMASSVESAMAIVENYYSAHGLPLMTNQQRADTLDTVNSLESMLNSSPSNVEPGAVSAFLSMLEQVEADLGTASASRDSVATH
jgi:hypothetical protein